MTETRKLHGKKAKQQQQHPHTPRLLQVSLRAAIWVKD